MPDAQKKGMIYPDQKIAELLVEVKKLREELTQDLADCEAWAANYLDLQKIVEAQRVLLCAKLKDSTP